MDPTAAQASDTAKLIESYNKTAWIGPRITTKDAREVLKEIRDAGWDALSVSANGH